MKFNTVLALALATGILSGCSSMKATSEHDREFDFGKIQTYQWIDGPEEIPDTADTYINEDIQKALDAELANRGLQQTSDENAADVQVAYYIKLQEHQEYASVGMGEREFPRGFIYSRENSTWGHAEQDPDLNAYTVEIGKLTVLIYDADTGKRIWRGNLQTEIDRSRPQDKQQAHIRAAAKKLIARLPATTD
ncbi:MAG: DUF4136 domain-containing protein [Verrucomicrobiota bacterium]